MLHSYGCAVTRNFLPVPPSFAGGYLILEPQPWKSYTSALHKQDMSGAAFRQLERLKLRPDAFVEFLTARVGFTHVDTLQVGGSARGFDRPLHVFQKPLQKPVKRDAGGSIPGNGVVDDDNML